MTREAHVFKTMINNEEAKEIAVKVAQNLEQELSNKGHTDFQSVVVVVSLLLFKLSALIMDNVGVDEAFKFLNAIHDIIDYLYAGLDHRATLSKEERNNTDVI